MGTVHNRESINYGTIGEFNGPHEKIINYGTIGTGNPKGNSNGRENTADGPKTTTQRATTDVGHDIFNNCTILYGNHETVDITRGKIIIDGTEVPKNQGPTNQGSDYNEFGETVFEGAYHRTATTSSIGLFRKIVNAIAAILRNK